MYYWTIARNGGATVGSAFADTFKEACEKIGADWTRCYVVRVTNA